MNSIVELEEAEAEVSIPSFEVLNIKIQDLLLAATLLDGKGMAVMNSYATRLVNAMTWRDAVTLDDVLFYIHRDLLEVFMSSGAKWGVMKDHDECVSILKRYIKA